MSACAASPILYWAEARVGRGRSSESPAAMSDVPRIGREPDESGRFDALYQEHAEDVGRLCRRLLGAGPEAEDACQEAFLRARSGFDGYDAARPFRTWLLSVTAHLCVDGLRRRSADARLFEPTDDDAQHASAGPSPLGAALDAEGRRRLLGAIEALPERYRAPLVLRIFADQSYDEIAATLDLRRDHVGTLLLRARRRLREQLGSGGDR